MARPRHYNTEEELRLAVDAYFVSIKGEKQQIVDDDGNMQEVWKRLPEPATITGLALYLGFCDRQSLYDYEKNDTFSCIIKAARTRVEHEYEKRLSSNTPAAGPIFALKNMGWKDKTEVDTTLTGAVNIIMEQAPNCAPIKDDYEPNEG